MNNYNLLEGKKALVTGARRGIGAATTLAMAAAGADVAAADVVTDDGLLDGVCAQIRDMGRESVAIRADISSVEDVRNMVRHAREALGRIDILVNCAGIWIPGATLLQTTDADWDRVIETNLKGTFFCCREVGGIMAEQKGGSIINLSSQVGINAGRGVGAYSISKAGIIMMTKQLALELGEYHVRVNALAPGVVKTDFNRAFWDFPGADKAAASVPLGRFAEAEDIARAAVYLASDFSDYVTGAVLPVDGGWRVGS